MYYSRVGAWHGVLAQEGCDRSSRPLRLLMNHYSTFQKASLFFLPTAPLPRLSVMAIWAVGEMMDLPCDHAGIGPQAHGNSLGTSRARLHLALFPIPFQGVCWATVSSSAGVFSSGGSWFLLVECKIILPSSALAGDNPSHQICVVTGSFVVFPVFWATNWSAFPLCFI